MEKSVGYGVSIDYLYDIVECFWKGYDSVVFFVRVRVKVKHTLQGKHTIASEAITVYLLITIIHSQYNGTGIF